ncbi:MAG: hypothetical protein ACLPVY_18545 [Acidimicrobiia bacterium]
MSVRVRLLIAVSATFVVVVVVGCAFATLRAVSGDRRLISS